MSGMTLLITDAAGVYIPQRFAENYFLGNWGFKDGDKDVETISAGPTAEWYWDAWDEILSRAVHRDASGHIWTLHQDGDLWAVCVDLMTDEEYEGYFGESREDAA
jgi:hypothetical protein